MSKSAIRTKQGLSARDLAGLDVIDQVLIEGVEADLPFAMLLRSAACSEEEAYGRIMRLLARGLLEEPAARSMFGDAPSAVRPVSACARVRTVESARDPKVGETSKIRTRAVREILAGERRASEPLRALPDRARPAPAPRTQLTVRELPLLGLRDARTLDSLPPVQKPEPAARSTASAQQVHKSSRTELAITMVDASTAQRGTQASTRRELSVTMVDDTSSELAQEQIAQRSLPPGRRAPATAAKSGSMRKPVAEPASARRPVPARDASEGTLDRSRTMEWTPQRVSAAEREEWPVPSPLTSERPKAPARMGLGSEPPEELGPLHKYPTGTVVGIGPQPPGLSDAKSRANTFESDEAQRKAGSRLRTPRQ